MQCCCLAVNPEKEQEFSVAFVMGINIMDTLKCGSQGEHHVISPFQSDGRAQSGRPAGVASPPAEEAPTAQQRTPQDTGRLPHPRHRARDQEPSRPLRGRLRLARPRGRGLGLARLEGSASPDPKGKAAQRCGTLEVPRRPQLLRI
jgi:hypothetical protein